MSRGIGSWIGSGSGCRGWAVGTYISRSDVEAYFGEHNVAEWGDVDASGDATAIATRVDASIAWAEGYATDRLRGGAYAVPFTSADGSALTTLTRCMVQLAGTDLFARRGVDRGADAVMAHRKAAEDVLSAILAGQIRLAAVRQSTRGGNAPVVVTHGRAADAIRRGGGYELEAGFAGVVMPPPPMPG